MATLSHPTQIPWKALALVAGAGIAVAFATSPHVAVAVLIAVVAGLLFLTGRQDRFGADARPAGSGPVDRDRERLEEDVRAARR